MHSRLSSSCLEVTFVENRRAMGAPVLSSRMHSTDAWQDRRSPVFSSATRGFMIVFRTVASWVPIPATLHRRMLQPSAAVRITSLYIRYSIASSLSPNYLRPVILSRAIYLLLTVLSRPSDVATQH